MSTTVTYKGQTLGTVENETKTLDVKGFYCEDDITLTDVTQGGGSGVVSIVDTTDAAGGIVRTITALPAIIGEFNTGATTGTTKDLDLSYAGNGYIVAVLLYVKGGVYNNSTGGNTTWYNSTQRYAIGLWGCVKSRIPVTPTYGTSGAANYGTTFGIYKNSTTSATTYSRASAMSTNAYTSNNPDDSGATATVKIKSNKKLTYYVANTSYGLLANTDYSYIVLYSS